MRAVYDWSNPHGSIRNYYAGAVLPANYDNQAVYNGSTLLAHGVSGYASWQTRLLAVPGSNFTMRHLQRCPTSFYTHQGVMKSAPYTHWNGLVAWTSIANYGILVDTSNARNTYNYFTGEGSSPSQYFSVVQFGRWFDCQIDYDGATHTHTPTIDGAAKPGIVYEMKDCVHAAFISALDYASPDNYITAGEFGPLSFEADTLAVGFAPNGAIWRRVITSSSNIETLWIVHDSLRDFIRLAAGQTSGTLTTSPLIPPIQATAWDTLNVRCAIPAGQSITVQLVDDDGNLLPDAWIPSNSTGISAASPIDMSGVSIRVWPRLKFNLSGTRDTLNTSTATDEGTPDGVRLYSVYATFDAPDETLTYDPIPSKPSIVSWDGTILTYRVIEHGHLEATTRINVIVGGVPVRSVDVVDDVGEHYGYDATHTWTWDGLDNDGEAVVGAASITFGSAQCDVVLPPRYSSSLDVVLPGDETATIMVRGEM